MLKNEFQKQARFSALEVFRDTIIAKEMENWERQRSILRDSMIEALIKQRVSDPLEWVVKVPHYQRSGTNQTEKNRYLNRICQIIQRIGSQHGVHIDIRFEDYDGHRIMVVNCARARVPVFLKDAGMEKFFMRNGTATRELSGNQQLEYIKSRFGPQGY